MKTDKVIFKNDVCYVTGNKSENKQLIFVGHVQMRQLYVIQSVVMFFIANYENRISSKKKRFSYVIGIVQRKKVSSFCMA